MAEANITLDNWTAVDSFASITMDRSDTLTASMTVSSGTATSGVSVDNISGSDSMSIITMDNTDVITVTTFSTTFSQSVSLIINKTIDTWSFIGTFATLGRPIIFHERADELPLIFHSRTDAKEVIFYSGEFGLDKKARFRLPIYSLLNQKEKKHNPLIGLEDTFESISMDQTDNPSLSVGTTLSYTVA